MHVDVYDAIKSYEVKNDCIERERYLCMVWNARQAIELNILV